MKDKKKTTSSPPQLPIDPYADIRVDGDGDLYVSWGVGYRHCGETRRRSMRSAVRLRDRKMLAMEKKSARIAALRAELERSN